MRIGAMAVFATLIVGLSSSAWFLHRRLKALDSASTFPVRRLFTTDRNSP